MAAPPQTCQHDFASEHRPGVLTDGRITINHPYVQLYINNTRRVANDRDVTPGDDPFNWKPRIKEDREVEEVLGLSDSDSDSEPECERKGNKRKLTVRESDCIFVLAALKVYYNPKHSRHFTFWGKEAAERTAEKVQKILGMSNLLQLSIFSFIVSVAYRPLALPRCLAHRLDAQG